MSYSLSHSDVRYWNALGSIGAGLSIILCLFILLSSLWIYQHRSARHTLDRISFRILLWSVVWEIGYSVDYLIVCANPSFVVHYSKTKACVAGVYFMVSTLEVVNWLHTCIALNLMITICLNRNPFQLGLEKWYIIGSTVLGLGVPIIPAILGHFGYDPVYGSCYFTSDSQNRIKYLISDMYLWQILSSVIATISVCATLVRLIRHGRKTTRLLIGGNSLNKAFHKDIENGHNPTSEDHSSSNSFTNSLPNCFPFNINGSGGQPKIESMTNRLQDKLFKISIKISLYPIALIIVNGIMTGGDLFLTMNGGVNSKSDYIIFLVYNFMFASRGIAFACLGIFIDPCLARGFKAVRNERNESKNRQKENSTRNTSPRTGAEVEEGKNLPILENSNVILPYQGQLTESGQEYSQFSSNSNSGLKALIEPLTLGTEIQDIPEKSTSISKLRVSYHVDDKSTRSNISDTGDIINNPTVSFTPSNPGNADESVPPDNGKRVDDSGNKRLKVTNFQLPIPKIHHARSESALHELKKEGILDEDSVAKGKGVDRRRQSEKYHNTQDDVIAHNTDGEHLEAPLQMTRRRSSGNKDEFLFSQEIERIFQEAQTRL